jgi:hypothetical protein
MINTKRFQIENGVLLKYTGTAKRVVVPKCVTSIGEGAFRRCQRLTSVEISAGVTRIGRDAFKECSSLTSVVIPGTVTSIGEGAFFGCDSLTSVEIPAGVTCIGDNAFNQCENLTSVAIPKGVTRIGCGAFQECSSLTSVVIPEGVTSIEDVTFNCCSSLTSMDIPKSVTSIGIAAFLCCEALASVVIPDGVTSIGMGAFASCKNLTSVIIPEGVTKIEHYTFAGCKSLTEVVIPDSVTKIEDNSFSRCPMLADKDGYVIIRQCIYGYFGNKGTAFIPEGVTRIGDRAFQNRKNLTNVVIPAGVQSIGTSAFHDCSSLDSVVIPAGVTSIGDFVFSGCNQLRSVDFMGAIPKLGIDVFSNCPNLILKPEIYFTTQRLEAALACGVPLGSAKAMAYIRLYQNGKSWDDAVDAAAKDHAEEIVEEIYSLLQSGASISTKLETNVASFMLKWFSSIQPEILRKLCRLLWDKEGLNSPEFMQLLKQLHEDRNTIIRNTEVIIGNTEVIKGNTEDIKATGEDTNRKVTSLVHFIESDLQDWLKEEKKRFSASSPSSDDEVCIADSIARSNAYINEQLRGADAQIEIEKRKLKGLFGAVWERLLPSTQTSLISAGVLWESCKGITNPDFDYSGICISSTSALECELRRWFYVGYQKYLMENAGDPSKMNPSEVWSKWPEELLNIDRYKYEKAVYKGEEIPTIGLGDEKSFTIGMLQYLFYKKKSANQALIKPYLQSIVKKDYYSNPGKAMNDFNNPNSFVKQIETVRVSYRNPAAHSEIILKDIAEECYQQIIGKAEAYRHETKVLGLIMLLYEFLE